jgi:hypothetical protein
MFYLANELYKQKNRTIRFIVGEPINVCKQYPELSDYEATLKIREKLYDLKDKV